MYSFHITITCILAATQLISPNLHSLMHFWWSWQSTDSKSVTRKRMLTINIGLVSSTGFVSQLLHHIWQIRLVCVLRTMSRTKQGLGSLGYGHGQKLRSIVKIHRCVHHWLINNHIYILKMQLKLNLWTKGCIFVLSSSVLYNEQGESIACMIVCGRT